MSIDLTASHLITAMQFLYGGRRGAVVNMVMKHCGNNAASAVTVMTASKTRKRKSDDSPVRVEGFVEETVRRYPDPTFKAHFRMNRSTFQHLLERLEPVIAPCRVNSNESKLLCFLWLMGNTETFRSVADRFGIGKSTLHRNLGNIASALLILSKEEIKFPKQHQLEAISCGFQKFPGVIGCVDGTYVPMTGKVGEKRDSYICRKGFPAMQVQVVCDSTLRILDITTGYPGSVHDARVYRNSSLYLELKNIPSEYHMLGDSAYPLDVFLMTPYKDNGRLSAQQKQYNMAHSSVRCCVERCFGLLKGKFRRLKQFDARDDSLMCRCIVGCAVVHNVILKIEQVDEAEIDVTAREPDEETGDIGLGDTRNTCAIKKRDDICSAM